MRRRSLCSLQHQEPWMKSSTSSVRSARMMWVFPTPKELREPTTKPRMFCIHVTNGMRSIYRRCFFVVARTAAGLWCHLHCHHYWDTVRNRCRCLVDVQWNLGEEANNVLVVSAFLPGILGWWWNSIPTWVLYCYTTHSWITNGFDKFWHNIACSSISPWL